jgi:hypothetical protein
MFYVDSNVFRISSKSYIDAEDGGFKIITNSFLARCCPSMNVITVKPSFFQPMAVKEKYIYAHLSACKVQDTILYDFDSLVLDSVNPAVTPNVSDYLGCANLEVTLNEVERSCRVYLYHSYSEKSIDKLLTLDQIMDLCVTPSGITSMIIILYSKLLLSHSLGVCEIDSGSVDLNL